MRLPESSTVLPGDRRAPDALARRPRAVPTWALLGLSLLLLAGLSMAAEPVPEAPRDLERMARDWLQPSLNETLAREGDLSLIHI